MSDCKKQEVIKYFCLEVQGDVRGCCIDKIRVVSWEKGVFCKKEFLEIKIIIEIINKWKL